MVANGSAVLFSQSIRRPKTVPKGGTDWCTYVSKDADYISVWPVSMYESMHVACMEHPQHKPVKLTLSQRVETRRMFRTSQRYGCTQ